MAINRSRLKNYNGLTDNEQRFCDEFLKNGGDVIEALIKVGYTKKSAKKIGYEWYRKPAVQNYLQSITKQVEKSTIATTTEVRERLTQILRGEAEMTEYINKFIGGGCQEIVPTVRKPNNREKLDAADKLLKVAGSYSKDVNLSIRPIVIKEDI